MLILLLIVFLLLIVRYFAMKVDVEIREEKNQESDFIQANKNSLSRLHFPDANIENQIENIIKPFLPQHPTNSHFEIFEFEQKPSFLRVLFWWNSDQEMWSGKQRLWKIELKMNNTFQPSKWILHKLEPMNCKDVGALIPKMSDEVFNPFSKTKMWQQQIQMINKTKSHIHV